MTTWGVSCLPVEAEVEGPQPQGTVSSAETGKRQGRQRSERRQSRPDRNKRQPFVFSHRAQSTFYCKPRRCLFPKGREQSGRGLDKTESMRK